MTTRTNRRQRIADTWKHIHRREWIIKNVYNSSVDVWTKSENQSHRLSKQKVHCSCPMCACKTNNRQRGYKNNWKHSDLKKIAFGNFVEELDEVLD